jgi:molybdopterin-containing oxidoreductase family iron-sulfur binding subunit
MVIDLDRCSGCQGCVTACRVENNIPPTDAHAAHVGRAFTWMEMIPYGEGHEEHAALNVLPRPCMHCDEPPCVKVCPVGATFKNREGIVGQIFGRCIGCRYCTTACPYTARYFNWYEPEWPDPMQNQINPDVSLRPKGVVEKCTLCHHRLQNARDQARAEQRDLRPGEYVPACVESCPAEAMTFGDLSDSGSEVAELARSRRAFKLLEDLGTEPKVIYLREGD